MTHVTLCLRVLKISMRFYIDPSYLLIRIHFHNNITNIQFSLFHFQKNVGRVMSNEEEVVAVLRKGNMMNLQVVDTAKMSYAEQLKVR